MCGSLALFDLLPHFLSVWDTAIMQLDFSRFIYEQETK